MDSQSPTNTDNIPEDTECAIVLGGDGTIIQASKDLIDTSIPILGVNLGTLGFLTEVEVSSMEESINKLMNDCYDIEERMMIEGEVIRDGKCIFKDYALNDIVIGRNGFSRIISSRICVNGELVSDYHGDGVIISTPTGSTGYNLSAGGPIVKADSKLMVITSICSHSLNSRSIVVDKDDKITIEVLESKKTQKDEAIATFDGRTGEKLKTADILEVKKADKVTRLIKIGDRGFFDVVRDKF